MYVLLWVDICARSIGRPVLFKFIVFWGPRTWAVTEVYVIGKIYGFRERLPYCSSG
jgi:hypothetical protein